MRKIRVLIVDDAVVIRQLVSKVLNEDPLFEVVGTAQHGRHALLKIPRLNPDVVTLDLEMPEMDGLETLSEIRKVHRDLPVVMLSSYTERGAQATLDALFLGATDYITKPARLGSAEAAIAQLRGELISKIKTLVGPRLGAEVPPTPRPVAAPARSAPLPPRPTIRSMGRVDIVAICASTGGPNAIADLMAELPAEFPVPIAIVQHMPQLFTKIFAERLGAKSKLRVDEAIPGGSAIPGHVWVAPGNWHMTVEREGTAYRVQINQGPPENSVRPAADVLLRSVAATYGPRSLAVILTGMGNDGLDGARRIREAGGQVLVQDEATSVVWGMPGFVARAGLADAVLPLDKLAGEILRRVWIGRAGSPAMNSSASAPPEP